MIDEGWSNFDQHQRTAYRARNAIGGVVLNLPDDTQPIQQHQTQGHVGEIRDTVATIQFHGFSSLPVAGGKAICFYPAGDRGNGVIIGTVDTRYRPTGLMPGETQTFMVDGAQKDGTGGTMRLLCQGLLGWIHNIFGKTINIGDKNAATIMIGTASNSITIDLGSSNAAVNITGGRGDVMVNGVSLVNHVHSNSGGSGDGGPPVQGT